MKVKLLKKLRKRYSLEERNGEYYLIYHPPFYEYRTIRKTYLMKYACLQACIERHRGHILHCANAYNKPKNIYKPLYKIFNKLN